MSPTGSGPARVLVVYETKTGSVTEIAETIGTALSDAGAVVDVMPVRESPDPSGYDAVVAGSGIRGGMWHSHLKSWVVENRDALRSRPIAFFSVGMTMTDPAKAHEMRAYTDAIVDVTGVDPVDVGTFEGWFVPARFGFAERSIMKLMKAPEGDHRDLAAVAAWAASIASRLGVRP